MCNTLKAVAKAMGEVIRGIYYPFVACSVMMPRILLLLSLFTILAPFFEPDIFRRWDPFGFLVLFSFLLRDAVRNQIPHLRITVWKALFHP